jgi:hypothetical protein
MNFEEAHEVWLERHLGALDGERARRVVTGHQYLERLILQEVWWPAFGTLEGLYPQYEVRDYRDGRRYIDHAYKPHMMKLALEADGFKPHVQDVTVSDHADNLLRDAHLIADGWMVVHFSTEIIKNRSREAQQLLRQIVWGHEGRVRGSSLSLAAREIVRHARSKGSPVSIKELMLLLGRCRNTVMLLIRELHGHGLIAPVRSDRMRVHGYNLTMKGRDVAL